jgi:hypothetical protein
MMSFGRFSAVVLPAYIVMGQLLIRCPSPVAAVILFFSAFFRRPIRPSLRQATGYCE